jgi:outer membrane usher protein FimD/PapC
MRLLFFLVLYALVLALPCSLVYSEEPNECLNGIAEDESAVKQCGLSLVLFDVMLNDVLLSPEFIFIDDAGENAWLDPHLLYDLGIVHFSKDRFPPHQIFPLSHFSTVVQYRVDALMGVVRLSVDEKNLTDTRKHMLANERNRLLQQQAVSTSHEKKDNEPSAVILEVSVNGQNMGVKFLALDQQSKVWLKRADLKAMNIVQLNKLLPTNKDEGQLFSLDSLAPAIRYELNNNTASLNLTVAPQYLPIQRKDFSAASSHALAPLRDQRSAFLTYSVTSLRDQKGQGGETAHFTLGGRTSGVLMLHDLNYTNNTRLLSRQSSQLIWDVPVKQQRWIIGDYQASGGTFAAGSLFGVQLKSDFSMQPQLRLNPSDQMTLSLNRPSDVTVLVNGVKTLDDHFLPGPLFLDNLPLSAVGKLEVIIRDDLGREQRIVQPYYRSFQLLDVGLHEYSYSLGVPSVLGQTGVRYSKHPRWVGYHRWGVTDYATLGLSSVLERHNVNLGGTAALLLGREYGELQLGGMLSKVNGTFGTHADLALFTVLSSMVSSRIYWHPESIGFSLIASNNNPSLLSASNNYGISFMLSGYHNSSFSVGYNAARASQGGINEDIRLGVSLLPYPHYQVHGGVQWQWNRFQHQKHYNTDLNVNYVHPHGLNLSVAAKINSLGNNSVFLNMRLSSSSPHQYDYKLSSDINRLGVMNNKAEVQGRLPFADFMYSRIENSRTPIQHQANLKGSLLYVGRHLYASRPLNGGFAVMHVEHPGVRIQYNHAEVGVSDTNGNLVIPSLMPYSEQILSLNASDAPLDYVYKTTSETVRIPAYGGVAVNFSGSRVKTIEGSIVYMQDGKKEPLADAFLEVTGADEHRETQSGEGGYFYLDKLTSNRYHVHVRKRNIQCVFDFSLKEVPHAMTNLGEVLCQ